MKTRKLKKINRHTQAVSRLAEINFWRRVKMLDSIDARKTLFFLE